jgi:hypothetical protein
MYCGNCLLLQARGYLPSTLIFQYLRFSRGKSLSRGLLNYGTMQRGRFRSNICLHLKPCRRFQTGRLQNVDSVWINSAWEKQINIIHLFMTQSPKWPYSSTFYDLKVLRIFKMKTAVRFWRRDYMEDLRKRIWSNNIRMVLKLIRCDF